MSIIIPISILVELLDRNVDDLEGSAWMILPFIAVLATYVVCGRIAGGLAPDAPLSHGALAALISFGGWLLVHVTIPLVLGNDLGFGGRAIVTDAICTRRSSGCSAARSACVTRALLNVTPRFGPQHSSARDVGDTGRRRDRIEDLVAERREIPREGEPVADLDARPIAIEGDHEEEPRSGAALDGLGDQLSHHVLDDVDVGRRAARIDHLGADLLAGTPYRGNLTRERATQRFHEAIGRPPMRPADAGYDG